MTLLIGRGAPNFNSTAYMPDGSISEFHLSDYVKDRMAVVCFYSMDFSHVCATELVALNNRYGEFERRDVRLVCVSGDSELSHKQWQNMSFKQGGVGPLKFPIVSDINHKIAAGYDVLIGGSLSARAMFLIDRIGVIRHQSINDFPLGRNMDEILRLIDAQIFHQQTGKLCPANWQPESEGIYADDKSLIQFMEKYADII